MPVHEGYLYATPGGNGVPAWQVAWGDALGNVALATKVGTVTEEYRDTSWECDFLQHNQDGELNGTLQFNHDWELDTEIQLHLHLLPMANGAGDAYFTFEYCFVAVGGALPAAAGWTSSALAIALVAGDQYKHTVRDLFAFTPSGGNASSILAFRIIRESTNILDTYDTGKDHGTATANLGIAYIDAHYRRARPGTGTPTHP
jgi:hypothetical protein